MRALRVFAGVLITAAVAVLALKWYVAVDSASFATDRGDDGGPLLAQGIAEAVMDFGVLLGLAGLILAFDRRSAGA